jgi:hypothetical protein
MMMKRVDNIVNVVPDMEPFIYTGITKNERKLYTILYGNQDMKQEHYISGIADAIWHVARFLGTDPKKILKRVMKEVGK